MKTSNKKINIVSLVPKMHFEKVKLMAKDWEKYFEINIILDTPKNLSKYVNSAIDILFLWSEDLNFFKLSYYSILQKTNPHFKYVAIKKEVEKTDFEIYKLLVDDIVYTDIWKVAKWKSISILRRYWNTFSKPSTIIYKDIIADFVDNNISVNGQQIELTKKESQLLKLFLRNPGIFLDKNDIFKKIWGFDEDTSRTLDQMIFKLKKKIGKKYFS